MDPEDERNMLMAIRSAKGKGCTKEYYKERVKASMIRMFSKDAGRNFRRTKFREANKQIDRLWNK